VAELREVLLGAKTRRHAGDAAGGVGAAAHGTGVIEGAAVPESGATAATLGGVLLANGGDTADPEEPDPPPDLRGVREGAAG